MREPSSRILNPAGMVQQVGKLTRIPFFYSLWQKPFVKQKLRPLLDYADWQNYRSVLDVGCGPGLNTPFFSSKHYVGIDLNEKHIAAAKQRFGTTAAFETANASHFDKSKQGKFDLVLLNSLMHHMDDKLARNVLQNAAQYLSPSGQIHIMDLVLPEKTSLARFFALADQGKFARSLEDWRHLFLDQFKELSFRSYSLEIGGLRFYQMVHFIGALKKNLSL